MYVQSQVKYYYFAWGGLECEAPLFLFIQGLGGSLENIYNLALTSVHGYIDRLEIMEIVLSGTLVAQRR